MNRAQRRQQKQAISGPPTAMIAKDTNAIFGDAVRALQADQCDQAERLCEAILAQEPRHAQALHLQGLVAYQSKRHERAIALIRSAIAIDPTQPTFYSNLGLALSALGKFTDAVIAFEAATRLAPTFADAYFNMGIALVGGGDPDRAVKAYRRAIEIDPRHVDAHVNLGGLLGELNRAEEAIVDLRRALELNPYLAEARFNLANVLRDCGRFSEAESSYRRALQINPVYADAHTNLGHLLKSTGRLNDAIESFRLAVDSLPGRTETLINLGSALHEAKEINEATEIFRRVIVLDHSNQSARHLLAALSGEESIAAPRQYVKNLFDHYADTFESHLVNKLGYDGPTVLKAMLDQIVPEDLRFTNAIDLGCGTGLSGLAFRNRVDLLTGIDISPEIIKQARHKKIYDQLEAGEIVSWLMSARGKFDLFIAADVFVYMGQLGSVFEAIRESALPDARLLFSTEKSNSDDILLCQSGRFAHGPDYIERVGQEHGFAIESVQTENLRKEHGAWIEGQFFILKRSN